MLKNNRSSFIRPAILIALVLVAASYGIAYTELWIGTFPDMDEITYNERTYSLVRASCAGYIRDVSGQEEDDFDGDLVAWSATYTCDAYPTLDSIVFTGDDCGEDSKITGTKETGMSGHKEGSGYWYAEVDHYGVDLYENFCLEGTWDTGTSSDEYYFDYDPLLERPPQQPVASGYCEIIGTFSEPAGELEGNGIWNIIRYYPPAE